MSSEDNNKKFTKEALKAYSEPAVNMVDHPPHYTSGSVEVIEVIEDAIRNAPTPKGGMLQAQVIKYILRMWLKGKPAEDAKKAQWYLNRLIESLN